MPSSADLLIDPAHIKRINYSWLRVLPPPPPTTPPSLVLCLQHSLIFLEFPSKPCKQFVGTIFVALASRAWQICKAFRFHSETDHTKKSDYGRREVSLTLRRCVGFLVLFQILCFEVSEILLEPWSHMTWDRSRTAPLADCRLGHTKDCGERFLASGLSDCLGD